jgi:hypothetical protein
MARSYKVLGQNNPTAATATTLYTVPGSTQTVLSTISVCNFANTAATYRIAIRPTGEALASKHYVAYDSAVPANDTAVLTLGLTMNTTDILTVYASTASVSFGVFGSEIS